MSSSTIFIKPPLNYRRSLAVIKQKYEEFSPVLSYIMWMVTGIYATAKSHFNSNITGITLSFTVHNILTMMMGSMLLLKGLNDKKIILILPWIAVTIYTLYVNHYVELLTTVTSLKRVKKLSWLPWANLTINVILLIIRVTVIIRTFQLCVHIWVKNKLKSMKEI